MNRCNNCVVIWLLVCQICQLVHTCQYVSGIPTSFCKANTTIAVDEKLYCEVENASPDHLTNQDQYFIIPQKNNSTDYIFISWILSLVVISFVVYVFQAISHKKFKDLEFDYDVKFGEDDNGDEVDGLTKQNIKLQCPTVKDLANANGEINPDFVDNEMIVDCFHCCLHSVNQSAS